MDEIEIIDPIEIGRFLPLTIGFGESAALRAPMALAVIGGLISSTILSLIVIPCIYYYIEHLRRA